MHKKETVFDLLMASSQVTISGFVNESGVSEKNVHRSIRGMFLKSIKYMASAANELDQDDVRLVFHRFKGRGEEGRRAAFDLIVEHRAAIRAGFLREERAQEARHTFRQTLNAKLHPLSIEDIEEFNELNRLPIHPSTKPSVWIPIPMEGDAYAAAEEMSALMLDLLPKVDCLSLRQINGASRRRFREWLAEKGASFLGDTFSPGLESQRKIEASIRLLERSGYVVQRAT